MTIAPDDTGWFSEDAATFGDRLAGAREAAGLSQADLSEQLGVKEATIDAWENDIKEPRANRVQMLSGLLGVSLRWLLTGVGDGPDAPQDVDAMDADVEKILADMRKVRVDMAKNAVKLGQLEKRLRGILRGTA